MSTEPAAPPIALGAIFLTFLRVGLMSVGGGGSAHIHRAVVEDRKWVDEAGFVEMTTVARVMPGTNVSNLAAFIGAALRGPMGALCAACGVVAPGAAAIVAAAAAYAHAGALRTPMGQGFLRGLTAGALGVMVVLVARSARGGVRGVLAATFAVAAFAAVGLLGINMAFVLVVLVPLAALVMSREST